MPKSAKYTFKILMLVFKPSGHEVPMCRNNVQLCLPTSIRIIFVSKITLFEVSSHLRSSSCMRSYSYLRSASYLRSSSSLICIKCPLVVFFYSPDTLYIPSRYCFKLFRSADETRRDDETETVIIRLTQSS